MPVENFSSTQKSRLNKIQSGDGGQSHYKIAMRIEVCEPPEIITNQKVSIEEAARRLGKSQQFIRISLQNGAAPFGFATKGTGSTYDYHISPKLLNEYIGEKS